jgi:hypothetical protein
MDDKSIEPTPPSDREPAFLPHPVMDRLVEISLELGAQLWIERDRRQTLERILIDRGLLASDAIENYRHTPESQAARERDKNALVARLFGSLNRL